MLEYDGDSGALELRVVSYSPTPTGDKTATALNAYTRVHYRVTARFAGGLPARVEVYHTQDEDAAPVFVDSAPE